MMHIAQNLFEFIKFTKFSTTTRVVVFQDGHGDSFGSFLKQKKNNYWFIYHQKNTLSLCGNQAKNHEDIHKKSLKQLM